MAAEGLVWLLTVQKKAAVKEGFSGLGEGSCEVTASGGKGGQGRLSPALTSLRNCNSGVADTATCRVVLMAPILTQQCPGEQAGLAVLLVVCLVLHPAQVHWLWFPWVEVWLALPSSWKAAGAGQFLDLALTTSSAAVPCGKTNRRAGWC